MAKIYTPETEPLSGTNRVREIGVRADLKVARFSWTGNAASGDELVIARLPSYARVLGVVVRDSAGANADANLTFNGQTVVGALSFGAAAGVVEAQALSFDRAEEESEVALVWTGDPASTTLTGYVLYVVH